MLLTCISDPSEEHAEIGTEKCRKKIWSVKQPGVMFYVKTTCVLKTH